MRLKEEQKFFFSLNLFIAPWSQDACVDCGQKCQYKSSIVLRMYETPSDCDAGVLMMTAAHSYLTIQHMQSG